MERAVTAPFSSVIKYYRRSCASPALAAASCLFVDFPPGNALCCKLFPSSKFAIHLFPFFTE